MLEWNSVMAAQKVWSRGNIHEEGNNQVLAGALEWSKIVFAVVSTV